MRRSSYIGTGRGDDALTQPLMLRTGGHAIAGGGLAPTPEPATGPEPVPEGALVSEPEPELEPETEP
eukprot:SAG22_NODE_523_length_9482_cov_4.992548_4_plen_67_part_00